MGLGDLQHAGSRVDGCHAQGVGEACGGLCEYAATAADVEVAQFLACGLGGCEAAGLDEVVAEGVHEVEESGGAVRVPP